MADAAVAAAHEGDASGKLPQPRFRLRGESFADLSAFNLEAQVVDVLQAATPYREEVVTSSVTDFFEKLGLPSYYFATNTPDVIAQHVSSLLAAKELARASGRRVDVQVAQESADGAFFAARSIIVSAGTGGAYRMGDAFLSPANVLEQYIDGKFFGNAQMGTADFRSLQSFTSSTSRGLTSLARPTQPRMQALISEATRGAHQQHDAAATQPSTGGSGGNPAQAASASSGEAQPSMSHSVAPPSPAVSPAPLKPGAAAAPEWRLQCYRSRGVLEDGAHLRLYFIKRAQFLHGPQALTETRIERLGDVTFLSRTSPELMALYQQVLTEASSRMAPSILVKQIPDIREGEDSDVSAKPLGSAAEGVLLLYGVRYGSTHSLFSSMPDIYRSLNMYAVTKYVEPFANGIVVYTFKLRPLEAAPQAMSIADAQQEYETEMMPAASPMVRIRRTSIPETLDGSRGKGGGHLHVATGSGDGTTVAAGAALRAKRQERFVGARAVNLAERIRDLHRDATLHFVLPRTSLSPLINSGVLSVAEAGWAYAAWKFAYHCALSRGRMSEEFSALLNLIKNNSAVPATERSSALSLVSRLRKAVHTHSFTESQILETIFRYPEIVAWCYDDFCKLLKPRKYLGGRAFTPNPVSALFTKGTSGGGSGSGQPEHRSAFDMDPSAHLRAKLRLAAGHQAGADAHGEGQPAAADAEDAAAAQVALSLAEADAHVRKMVVRLGGSAAQEEDAAVFAAFIIFNRSIERTNFFTSIKTSLSFKLNPSRFLASDYAETPYSLLFVVGAEFRGFHVRFSPVARGGVRLVKSASAQAYAANVAGLFDEVYSLSLTQHRKNKDIPEGGSKGIILLNLAHQDKDKIAFTKYIDGLLDVLLPSSEMVDRSEHPGPDLLFLGPDENTGEFMDAAALQAAARSYPRAMSFTTGKGPALGGVPHDTYGMTTRGVRQYEKGIMRKLGLDPSHVTKIQTGGPDGDLGSNELLDSTRERTLAVVDGSGVLYDPAGIDREELLSLARKRQTVANFRREKLSPGGFLVLVSETDVRLPDGTIVSSGMQFRNTFHLWKGLRADFFVPCGGRPAAVTVETVNAFLEGADAEAVVPQARAEGAGAPMPRFRVVVEGANVFFTQDARLALEARGVILVKDASANKGGVTSSSLEVLSALALTEEEYAAHMCVPADGAIPAFRQAYIEEIQRIIEDNAEAEFQCLWKERERTHQPFSVLSDTLSTKIVELSGQIEKNETLWTNLPLRRTVLHAALPTSLAALVGGPDALIARLPPSYCRALFGSRLASRYVYLNGVSAPEFAFFTFCSELLGKAEEAHVTH